MLKVSEIPYERYTIEQAKERFAAYRAAWDSAKTAEEALAARKILQDAMTEYSTAASLANNRFNLNTTDEFYAGEVEYYDGVSPMLSALMLETSEDLLTTPLRPALEKLMNPRIFAQAEIAKKAFSPEVIADCQEENAAVTEYSKFMSGLLFEYEGKQIPLSTLRGGLEDSDREVRRKTAESIGLGLQKHAAELDGYYDKLVKIRTRIARKLGYKTFTELGYYRMGRLDYNAEMVKTFRDNVKNDLVPVVEELKKSVAEKLGIDKVMFYDDAIYLPGLTPRPVLDKAGIFAAAKEMYNKMDPEIGAFMEDMQAAEAFDVESRPGKWGGGYCTCFPKYEQPFILANFNGSAGDIDVMTHEFGHAFAAKNVFRYGDVELDVGGMETAECHSMSMEFLSWPYMDKFFGEAGDRYRFQHMLSSLSFIPYGVIVDEFQHLVYENPDWTPAERKEAYLSLEKKYRPYMELAGIPYLEEGTRWQYQMHIFETPFYYIDYCLAQTVALGFLMKSREDYEGALKAYIAFSRAGGTKPFPRLIEEAGVASPFTPGALKTIADGVEKIGKELKV